MTTEERGEEERGHDETIYIRERGREKELEKRREGKKLGVVCPPLSCRMTVKGDGCVVAFCS